MPAKAKQRINLQLIRNTTIRNSPDEIARDYSPTLSAASHKANPRSDHDDGLPEYKSAKSQTRISWPTGEISGMASQTRCCVATFAPTTPAPPPALRSAHGTASRTRSRARRARRNSIERGSPPCSPQMPILMPGARLAAARGADLDEFADALLVDGDERGRRAKFLSRCTARGTRRRRRARCRGRSGSGRWCRRRKNSAVCAMSAARKPRTGQLDHRADGVRGTSCPLSWRTAAAIASIETFTMSSSVLADHGAAP